jgi:hypothetical protein
MWGDPAVVLYAARPTVWQAYKKRKFFNVYNWFLDDKLDFKKSS